MAVPTNLWKRTQILLGLTAAKPRSRKRSSRQHKFEVLQPRKMLSAEGLVSISSNAFSIQEEPIAGLLVGPSPATSTPASLNFSATVEQPAFSPVEANNAEEILSVIEEFENENTSGWKNLSQQKPQTESLSNSDGNGTFYSLEGEGYGSPEVEIIYGPNTLATSGDTLGFGTYPYEPDYQETIVIQNIGTSDLVISSTSVSGAGFSIVDDAAGSVIAPGKSVNMVLSMTTSPPDFYSGQLSIYTNDSDEPYFLIGLSGEVAGTPSQVSGAADDTAQSSDDSNCGCRLGTLDGVGIEPPDMSPKGVVHANVTLTGDRPENAVIQTTAQLGSGTPQSTYYSTTGLPTSGNVTVPIGNKFDVSGLSTGRYDYTIKLSSDGFSSSYQNYTHSGTLTVQKPDDGDGTGNIYGVGKLTEVSGGAIVSFDSDDPQFYSDNGDDTYSLSYDPNSLLTKNLDGTFTLTDKSHRTFDFGATGLLLSSTLANGRSTTYAYSDQDGDSVADEITTVTSDTGQSITFGYSGGKLASMTDVAGRTTSYTYDTYGRIATVTTPDPDATGPLSANVKTYTYDSEGLLVDESQSNGLSKEYVRDQYGFVKQVVYSDQSSISKVNYDTRGLPADTYGTSGNPAPLTKVEDAWGSETDSEGVTTYYATDSLKNVTRTKDELGNVTEYERTSEGWVSKITDADPDGGGPKTSPVHEYTYDGRGNILTETLPDNSVRTWVYHSTWNAPVKYTDAIGNVTFYTYDNTYELLLSERVVIGLDDDASSETDDLTTTYTYTPAPSVSTDPPLGLLASTTAPDGVVTEYEYNANGYRTKTTYAVGTSDEAYVTATYDDAGNMLTETDELGNTTTYTYDNYDRVDSITMPDPDGAGSLTATVISYTYNSFDLLETESVNGRTTTYSYDKYGRLDTVTEEDPDDTGPLLAPETSYTYDSDGNVLTITDPLGNVTSYGYTDGLLTSITEADPDGAGSQTAPVTSMTYDDAGRLLTVTDPLGQVTTYAYDDLGREISVTLADPDGAGPLTSLSSTTGYDAFGRVISETDFQGITTTYTYDSESNLLTETTPLGTTSYTYDELNRLVEVETADPDGVGALVALVTTYSYTASGQLASITTSKGTTTYAYDSRRRRTSVTLPDPDGAGGQSAPVSSTTYDDAGNVLTETDSLGNVTSYEYDARNRLIEITSPDPDGAGSLTSPVTAYAYDEFDQLVSMTDPNGGVTTYEYDDLGRQTKVIYADPDGAGAQTSPEVSYVYDAKGQLTSMTDELGNVTSYSYDNLGRRISVTLPDPDGAGSATSPVYAYEFDAIGQLISETDPLGRTTSYTYDAMGRLLTETLPDPDGIAPAGPLTAPVTTYAYNNSGQLASVTDAESQTVSYTYNSAGLVATMTDPRGTTVYSYDALGREIAIYEPDPDGAGSQLAPVTLYQYNDDGELVATITRDGRTSYEYDNLGRITKITEADPDDVGLALGSGLGSGTGAAGSATGGPEIVVTDGVLEGLVLTDGSSTVGFGTVDVGSTAIRTFEITNIGDSPLTISSISLPSVFKIISYSDDEIAAGESTTITIQFTPTTVASYSATLTINNDDSDESSFQVGLTGYGQASTNGSEVAASTSYTYDAVGRITSETDALGHTTSYAYDHLGRLVKKTDAELGETTYTYDANGNRLTLTDPVSNTTTWTYDALNRMLTDTNELSDTRNYEYDAAGNVVEYTDRNGRVTVYEYDNLQRRTAEKWMDGVSVVRTLSYTYDAASQLTSASDPATTYTFAYDNLGRNISTTHDLAALGFDVVIAETYDAIGRRTSLAAEIDSTDDLVNTYTYDYLNRMTRVTQGSQIGGNAVAEKRVDFTYDAEDKYQFTSIARYADLAGSELVATSEYAYDAADRLAALNHVDSGSSTLAGYTWAYDEGNRLTAFTVYGHSAEDATYTYDDTDQLTGADRSGTADDESYAYDENGNRTNTGYSTGTNNQLLSDGTYNYTYDDEGNRLTKTNISTGDYVEYTWDYRNRLVEILTKSSGGTVTHEVDYTYDIFNRRIVKTIDADGAGGGTATEEVYIYDGLREERGNAGDHMLLLFDEADDLVDRFMYGANVDQILASEEVTSISTTGDVLWALSDHLGTIRDVVDYDAGIDETIVQNHLMYDAFGRVTSESNASVDFLFGFTGREIDEESDEQYSRGRYYNALTGRWINQDPIGFEAGDENLYRYVSNGPATGTDPSGLAEIIEVQGGGVIIRHKTGAISVAMPSFDTPNAVQVELYNARHTGNYDRAYIDRVAKFSPDLILRAQWELDNWEEASRMSQAFGTAAMGALESMGNKCPPSTNTKPSPSRGPTKDKSPKNATPTKKPVDPELEAQSELVGMTGKTKNAHYLGKHSPLVSLKQLYDRAVRGIDPWTGKTGPKRDSTRFHSYRDMQDAINKAKASLKSEYPDGTPIPQNKRSQTIDLQRNIGEGYQKNTGVYKNGLRKARVIFDEFGDPISAYPIYSS